MVKKIIVIILLLISSFCFFDGCQKTSLKIRQCGTVVLVQNQPYQSKAVTYYDQYLLVNFDSTGMEAIKVDMTTFLSHKKGDRVCFILNPKQMHSPDHVKYEMMASLGLFFTLILIIITIGVFVDDYFTD